MWLLWLPQSITGLLASSNALLYYRMLERSQLLVTFQELVLSCDVFPHVFSNGFGADVLPNGFGLLAELDVFVFAGYILHKPVNLISIHFSKYKLGVIGQIDFSTSDSFQWRRATLENT